VGAGLAEGSELFPELINYPTQVVVVGAEFGRLLLGLERLLLEEYSLLAFTLLERANLTIPNKVKNLVLIGAE